MHCREIENFLPAFLEDDLSEEDSANVRSHVDGCVHCQESLVAYQALEEQLVLRKQEVPNVRAISHAVFRQLGISPWHRALRVALSLPVLSSAALFFAAIFFFTRRESVVRTFSGDYGLGERLSLYGQKLSESIVVLAGGDMQVLIGAYVTVALLILLSTSLVVNRFVRS